MKKRLMILFLLFGLALNAFADGEKETVDRDTGMRGANGGGVSSEDAKSFFWLHVMEFRHFLLLTPKSDLPSEVADEHVYNRLVNHLMSDQSPRKVHLLLTVNRICLHMEDGNLDCRRNLDAKNYYTRECVASENGNDKVCRLNPSDVLSYDDEGAQAVIAANINNYNSIQYCFQKRLTIHELMGLVDIERTNEFGTTDQLIQQMPQCNHILDILKGRN